METTLLKIENQNEKVEIIYENGVYVAIKDDEVVYQSEDYETVRFVALGW